MREFISREIGPEHYHFMSATKRKRLDVMNWQTNRLLRVENSSHWIIPITEDREFND